METKVNAKPATITIDFFTMCKLTELWSADEDEFFQVMPLLGCWVYFIGRSMMNEPMKHHGITCRCQKLLENKCSSILFTAPTNCANSMLYIKHKNLKNREYENVQKYKCTVVECLYECVKLDYCYYQKVWAPAHLFVALSTLETWR